MGNRELVITIGYQFIVKCYVLLCDIGSTGSKGVDNLQHLLKQVPEMLNPFKRVSA